MTDPIFNRDLVNDVARGRVVVFVGSGVSASAKTRGGKSIRSWEAFLKHAASHVEAVSDRSLINELISGKDYLMACEILKESLASQAWADLIYEEFSQVGEPSDLHKAIVSLDQRIILTTNFDKLLENTWPQTSGLSTHYPQVVSNISSDIFKIYKEDKKVIVKLHGTIDDPEGMVFAKADYVKKAFSSWVYNQFVESLLVTHTFIFIGFSMADPALSLLVENYAQKYPTARPHYIFQGGKGEPRLAEVAKRLRKLYIINYDDTNHHAALAPLVEELARQGRERRKEILATALANA